MVGSPRGVDVNRAGRCSSYQQAAWGYRTVSAGGRCYSQDKGCNCPQTLLRKKEGLVLPRLETSQHLPLDCRQPAFPSCLHFMEMCDPEAVPGRKVWFKDQT